MHTLILDKHDISLEYENQCLIVRQNEEAPRTLPLGHIRKILCLHSVQLTTSLLGQLWQRGIDFVMLNSRYSDRSFALFANQHNQVERRCLQYQWQLSSAQCLPIAKELCAHRIKHNLKQISAQHPLAEALQANKAAMQHSTNLDQLRGIEGISQKLFFDYWRELLPTSLGFEKRTRRPPTDPVNALLSLTYSIVMQDAVKECIAAGLDSQLGFYHRTSFGRHSLACDIMEPTRALCEEWVFHQFINKTFNNTHFTKPKDEKTPCLLGKQGREIYYQLIASEVPQWQKYLKATARWLSHLIEKNLSASNQHEQHPPLVLDSL